MKIVSATFKALYEHERSAFIVACVVLGLALMLQGSLAFQEKTEFVPVQGGSYIEGVAGQPTALNPVIATNQIDRDINTLLFSSLKDFITHLEISEDRRTYVVKLDDGLLWDDGKHLTSDDIIFTIKTIQDPEARSPLLKNWQGVIAERISELQVRFTLPAPYQFFDETIEKLRVIPEHIFYAVPPANFKLSSYLLEPVGNGPYRFKEFSKRKDGFITTYHLVPNEMYHKERPFIQDFYFRFYEDSADLAQAFRLRQISGFGLITPPENEFANSSFTKIDSVYMPRYYALFLNPVTNPLFKDKDIRNALNLALDKKALAREFLGDESLAIADPILTLPRNQSSSSIEFDPEVAQALIAKSKIQEKAITLTVPNIPFLESLAERIQTTWLAAGIQTVTIAHVDQNDLTRSVLPTRNYEALLFGNIYENPLDLFPFWHSSQRFSPGFNLSLYQNADIDKLIETIRQSDLSRDEQEVRLIKIQTAIQNDAPAIFLFTLPYTYIHSTRLQGFAAKSISDPAERFTNVQFWNMARVRAIK